MKKKKQDEEDVHYGVKWEHKIDFECGCVADKEKGPAYFISNLCEDHDPTWNNEE